MSTSPSPLAVFLAGAGYHARAARLLVRTPALWRFVWVPMAISTLAALALYAGSLTLGWQAIAHLAAQLPAWAAWAGPLLKAVLALALLVVIGLVIAKFGVVLGSPWYGQLSEAIEEQALGADMPDAPHGPMAMLRDIGRAIGFEGKKLVLTLGLGLPLLAMNLLPVLGSVVAAAGGAALAVLIANLDFGDPPLERRRLRFRQKIGVVVSDPVRSAGFGLVAVVLVGIPLVNLLTVPLGMAAGTLMFLDRRRTGVAPDAAPSRR